MKERDPECMLCGRMEYNHHDFVEREEGCECEVWDGADEYLSICKRFRPLAKDEARCSHCEHDRKCHASEKVDQ
jgi:hypothetical protein